jgi:hypothetical protein
LMVSNLPPTFGNPYYRFRAQAVDRDGNIGETIYPLSFAVKAAPHERPVFGPLFWGYHYLDDGEVPGTGWNDDPLFNLGETWKLGAAPFVTGFDSGRTIDYPAATYFRADFSLEDGTPVTNATLHLASELADGVVVYLNGVEILRRNLPPGSIAHTHYTGLAASDPGYLRIELPPGLLLPAFNFVAVAMHQNRPDSGALLFDLALVGTDQPAPSGLSFFFNAEEDAFVLQWDWIYWLEGWLQVAADPAGPWTDIASGAEGSHTQPGDWPQRFYRLRK